MRVNSTKTSNIIHGEHNSDKIPEAFLTYRVPFGIEDYLSATCVTQDKAVKDSKMLSHLKSP
jgi:hypothetical protein